MTQLLQGWLMIKATLCFFREMAFCAVLGRSINQNQIKKKKTNKYKKCQKVPLDKFNFCTVTGRQAWSPENKQTKENPSYSQDIFSFWNTFEVEQIWIWNFTGSLVISITLWFLKELAKKKIPLIVAHMKLDSSSSNPELIERLGPHPPPDVYASAETAPSLGRALIINGFHWSVIACDCAILLGPSWSLWLLSSWF